MPERIFPPSEIHEYHSFNVEMYRPKVQVFPRPVLLGAGFGANAETMQFLAHELSLQGFVAFCPDFRPGYEPRKLTLLPDVDRAKREAILGTIFYEAATDERYNPPVDVIAHSKNAIDTILVAKDHPEYFRNILLVAPGGIHPGRGFFAVALNLVTGDRRDHQHKAKLRRQGGITADLLKVNSEVSKAYRRSKVRVFLETLTSARVSIDQYFPKLQKAGVRIAIVAQEEDAFFQPHYLNPEGEQIPGVERFEVLPGVHGAMKFVPESCRRVIDILKVMESNNCSSG